MTDDLMGRSLPFVHEAGDGRTTLEIGVGHDGVLWLSCEYYDTSEIDWGPGTWEFTRDQAIAVRDFIDRWLASDAVEKAAQ